MAKKALGTVVESALGEMSRAELFEEAARLGYRDPEGLKNLSDDEIREELQLMWGVEPEFADMLVEVE